MREFETFETLEQLNRHVQFVLENFDLLERERSVFLLLSRYSVKFLGVSFLKVDSIAEMVGLHRRTVQRALKGLEKKGIITRLKRVRVKRGGYSSSLTLINNHVELPPRQDDENAPSVRFYDEETARETISRLSVKKSLKNNDTPDSKDGNKQESKNSDKQESKENDSKPESKNANDPEYDYSYIENRVPEWFLHLTKPFFNNHIILKMWYKVKKSFELYSSVPYIVDEDLTRKAVKSVIYSFKRGKIRGSLVGYLWGTMRNAIFDIESELSAQRRRQAIADGSAKFFNWLGV